MHAELAAPGIGCRDKRVWRLMRAAGLQGRHPRAWKKTTIHGERPVPAPDLIGRDFTATRAEQRWCGDITYIKSWDGWVYLATVIDLHSRRVVGWAVADHMRTSLVTDALQMALANQRPGRAVIFHSDRGTQYTSNEFASSARNNAFAARWAGPGSATTMRSRRSSSPPTRRNSSTPGPGRPQTGDEGHVEWIEMYYNRTRRHSTLGYLTPHEYELGFRDINQLAA